MATPKDQPLQSRLATGHSTDSPDTTVASSEATHAHTTRVEPNPDNASLNTQVASDPPATPPKRTTTIALPAMTHALDSAATRPHLENVTQFASADQLASPLPHQPPPRQVGSYEILQEIARGGMGVVYKAHQRGLNRVVALKMTLTGDFAGDQERERFRIEAEAAGKLDHPSIVPIYEVSEHEGRPFFSMGFVDGQSLKDLLANGPIAPRRAAEIVQRVAQAVDYAHSRGVVHRDLKPANIMLDSSGLPRITDFGLAKQVSTNSELTTTGQILGTPSFMPPEQAQGNIDQVGPLADVYSLGATLYCLLTGRPPFQAASLMDTLMQVAHQEPVSPRTLDPTIPRDLETICLKCLEKTPSRRYGSAQELAADLERFLGGEPVHARPLSRIGRGWRWCRRKPLAASLIAAVSLLFLFFSVGYWYRQQYAATAKQLALMESLKRLSDFHAGMSRAREMNARLQAGSTWLVEKELTEIEPLIPGTDGQPEWYSLLSDVQSRYDLRRVSSMILNMHVGAIAFSPDGKRLAIGQRKHATGFAVNIYDTSQIPTAFDVHATQTPSPPPLASYTVSTLDTAVSQLFSGNTRYQDGARSLAWSPDGRWLVVGSRFGKLTRWDTSQLNNAGITWSAGERPINRLWFSPDGKTLYSQDENTKHWDTTAKWQEVAATANDSKSSAVSPDGQFTASLDKQSRLVVRESKSAATFQLFPPADDEYSIEEESLTFIGDGRLLVGRDHSRHLHIWDIATGRESVQPIGTADDAFQWTYSAAKNWLVLTDVESKDLLQIYELRTPTSVRNLLQAGQPRAIEFSTDNKQLAVVSSPKIVDGTSWTELSLWPIEDANANEAKHYRALHRAHRELQPLPMIGWHPQKNQLAWFAGVDGLVVSSLSPHASQSSEPGQHRLVLRTERSDTLPLPLKPQPDETNTLRTVLPLNDVSAVSDEGSLPVQWSPDGKHLWGFIGSNKRLVAWEGETLQPLASWSNKFSDISTGQASISSFGVNENHVVCGGEDGYITVLPANLSSASATDTPRTIIPLSHVYGPGGPIRAIAVCPERMAGSGAWVAVASQTGSVQLRQLPGGESMGEIQSNHGSVETIALNATRQILATGGEDGAIRLYHVSTTMRIQPLITLTARIGVITQLKISPDGRFLAAIGNQSKSVTIWDLSRLPISS